ncbi:MAG: Cysteine protease atg4 [Thelocarpon impressellum]|nr:MAG: Cysteine protease atg4 [Thelocarpon impressellum]
MTSVDLGGYKRIVRYFWDPEPKNDDMSQAPIWCLGRKYTTSSTPPRDAGDRKEESWTEVEPPVQLPASTTSVDSLSESFESGLAYDEASAAVPHDGGWPPPFLDDFESRIWLTYRSGFPPIPKSESPQAAAAMTLAVRLRSQLVDQAGFTSDTGALSNAHESTGLRVYITGDGSDVYEDRFMRIANPSGEGFRPTLVLVGIRLGIDRVTPVYWEALKSSLQMPQSVGIAGGRPSSSHYFIGVQGPNFFYLDPHQTRSALPLHDDPESYSPEEMESCHTRRLRRLHITEMDPSMLIAFLIRDEADWAAWRQQLGQARRGGGKAVIHVADREPAPGGLGGGHGGPERASALDEVEILSDDDDDSNDALRK